MFYEISLKLFNLKNSDKFKIVFFFKVFVFFLNISGQNTKLDLKKHCSTNFLKNLYDPLT